MVMKNRPYGYIYVIGCYEHMKCVKIGYSRSRPEVSRLQQLQCGNPYHLHVYAAIPVSYNHVQEVEANIHRKLSGCRLKGEWFKIDPKDAIEVAKSFVEGKKFRKGAL